MTILQPLLDFLLSFFKMSTNKILIALLTLGLIASLYTNRENNIQNILDMNELRKENNTLRSEKVQSAIDASKREMQMMKDCYEEKENISKQLDVKIKELKK